MKKYNPKEIEKKIYQNWEKKGYFNTNDKIKEKNFCIMLPPPNITGSLHMGHAFQQTIMDTLIRYQRMNGKNVLWQIGTDHAGIATQIVVEKKLLISEGKNRQDYKRKDFIKKILDWKDKANKKIIYQMKRLGNSADWKRKRFTMDKGFSKAVKKVFIDLYKNNFIYRMKSLVNWDVILNTAISDLEVEMHQIKGHTWYIKYPLEKNTMTLDGKNYLIVATTRPETMLGDTAIAVNPEDDRYKNLIGKFVIVPIIDRKIPIISDEYANISKGSGCVKITPAHDFNDYEVGKRNKLIMINIMSINGSIKETAQIYDSNGKKSNFYKNFIPKNLRNLERFVARDQIISELKKHGLLEKIISHNINVPYSERSNSIIEPMLTNQWYVKSKLLSTVAIDSVKNKKIRFIPIQYENMYFSWMKNIKDWCISRQLWWGHRIPIWYDNNNNIYVGYSEKQIRKEYLINDSIILQQDKDVLDTWFSSSLWTFASLGWPNKVNELNFFHPTDVLISGFDIIFFWIARMIMMTMHFIKNKDNSPQIPFKNIYITGLIRDEFGAKMSKSKGNVIDPIDIIDGISLNELLKKRTVNIIKHQLKEKICQSTKKQFPNGIKPYGADALRFTLLAISASGRDINLDLKRLEGYRNFCNKLWNASKFVILNYAKQDCVKNCNLIKTNLIDKWIVSELNKTIQLFHKAIQNYRFDIAVNLIYDFTWNNFCSWYLEFSKISIKIGNESTIIATCNTLINVLESLILLSHPVIPFITEFIWQKIKVLKKDKKNTIMFKTFPVYDDNKIDNKSTSNVDWIKKVIVTIRNMRSTLNINNKIFIKIALYKLNNKKEMLIKENIILLQKMLNAEILLIKSKINIFNSYEYKRKLDDIEIFLIKNI